MPCTYGKIFSCYRCYHLKFPLGNSGKIWCYHAVTTLLPALPENNEFRCIPLLNHKDKIVNFDIQILNHGSPVMIMVVYKPYLDFNHT